MLTFVHSLPLLAMLGSPCPAAPADAKVERIEIQAQRDYRVGQLPLSLKIFAADAKGNAIPFCGNATVSGIVDEQGDSIEQPIELRGEALEAEFRVGPSGIINIQSGEYRGSLDTASMHYLPGFLSIIPPLFAILLAMMLRQALLALFAGIWLGSVFVNSYNPLLGTLRLFDTYLPNTLADPNNAAIVCFTMALGGMVGILARSGATRSLVDLVSRRAKTRRSGMLATFAAGLVVFFDDYANCLLVGTTMRPLSDKLKISREKLAFLVDSTAAPVATLALVSTWIGYQVSQLEKVVEGSAYDVFLQMIPYAFYSILTLAFVAMVAISQRDFGPMLKAEIRAQSGKLIDDGDSPLMDSALTTAETNLPGDGIRAPYGVALGPVVGVIFIVAIGLYFSGKHELGAGAATASLRDIYGAAKAYAVLLWASFGGGIIAMVAAMATRSLSLPEALDAWIDGLKSMTLAVLILVSAWAIGGMCKTELMTGAWVLSAFSPSPVLLPILTFVVCALIAFATGSSFSTMAIVIPIAGPMAYALTGDGSGIEAAQASSIQLGTFAAVLSGAVFGDHCSPISDTTIMSSISCASDHMAHVRTQAPYAIICASVAALVGYIPAGFGLPPAISLVAGIIILAAILFVFGKRSELLAPKAELLTAED